MMMMRRTVALVALAGSGLGMTLIATPVVMGQTGGGERGVVLERGAWGERSALPIREVTLYRSGVGAFVRGGRVAGRTDVSLRFETEQINDILKSMYVLDPEGRVEAVSYGSKEPLSRRLASFGVDLSAMPSVAQLMGQLRGARARIKTMGGDVEGTVMGVEDRQTVERSGEGAVLVREPYVVMNTGTGVRAVAVSQIASFELMDPGLMDELARALDAITEHRTDRTKSVDLSLSGPEGRERSIVVGYVHEMPVWKASYRLVLGDDGDAARLMAYAIVENTTDEDWDGVRLSLASGQPVAFTMDLYEPVYVKRPTIAVPVGLAAVPRAYEGVMGKTAAQLTRGEVDSVTMRDAMSAPSRAALGGRAAQEENGAGASDDFASYALGDQLVVAGATGGEFGEQFMYVVDAPVRLERRRSAMLPIASAEVEGRRVSIYRGSEGGRHPMRGVEVMNGTGLSLMPGPVAVYDGNVYAGDAQLPNIARNQRQMLAYAVDLDVNAASEVSQRDDVVRLRIVDGMIEREHKGILERSYTFENMDSARDRVVIVEQGRTPGWELAEGLEPLDATGAVYRFEVAVRAGAKGELKVKEERTYSHRIAVTTIGLPTVLAHAQSGKVSDAVVDAVRRAAEIQSRVNRENERITELDRAIAEIARDQDRIRSNMRTINQQSDLYKQYMAKLTEQEAALDRFGLERESAHTAREKSQRELEAFLRGLNIE